MTKRILIIGEAPVFEGADPFSGPTGRRLDTLFGRPWNEVADGVNLLPPQERDGKGRKFDQQAARSAARKLAAGLLTKTGDLKYAVLLFAGFRVADAFGFSDIRFFELSELFVAVRDTTGLRSTVGAAWLPVAAIPHPSGTVRSWNDPAVTAAASKFVRQLV